MRGRPRTGAGGWYPLFVPLGGRRCVVVGGGVVAEAKVSGLLATGAHVTVVSPALTDALAVAAHLTVSGTADAVVTASGPAPGAVLVG